MPDSILLLIAIGAIAFFGAVWIYAGWESWDDRRRSDRLVKRNLDRMCGR